MEIKPTIVISAYNRPYSLQRLLNSLASAIYKKNDINLIISIDKSIENEVENVADKFEWKFGDKKVINHETHLGLKNHILFCGALTKTYEAIILLEDDLMVSPYFYDYANQALNYYINDTSIAGISLYNYQISESSFYHFQAVDDGSDVYFIQMASSRGQLWTKQQWESFENWFILNPELVGSNIPLYLKQWGQNSWKKHFVHYLIENSKYFVFPRLSVSTNFEDAGTNPTTTDIFQVALQLTKKEYQFRKIGDSNSIYDVSFEILPKCINTHFPALAEFSYEIDLYGTKDIVENDFDYILSSKKAQNPILSFSASLIPLEANLILNLPGNDICLYKKSGNQFSNNTLSLQNQLVSYHHKKENSITVVIPICEFNLYDLKATVDSVIDQKISITECLLVSNSINYELVKLFMMGYGEKLRLIVPDTDFTLTSLLALGFKRATNGIVTWALPGNLYDQEAFIKVDSIFKSFPKIDWIAGLDHSPAKKTDIKNIELRKYRLNHNDIYKHLSDEILNTDTQLQFFKRYCVIDFINENYTVHDLFFKLSNSYPCFVVVYKFGIRSIKSIPNLSRVDTKRLLLTYKYFKFESKSLHRRLAYRLLSSKLLPGNLNYLFGIYIKNLPDVIRLDESDGMPRLSKY